MKPSDASEETIFDAARQMPDPQARASYLNAACAGNPILRQRIEDLLKAGLQADQFLAGDPLELGAAGRQTILVGPLSEGPGTVIGNYKLLEKLGEGGFGVVYMAEQKQPVKRRVALKIIKVGMDTREVVARFEAERQALAILDHPNIAKVFDAGATDAPHLLPSSRSPLPSDGRGIKGEGAEGMAAPSLPSSLSPLPSVLPAGRPYFVMELVRGIKITDYCDQTNLPTRERLDLFMQVCQAVQHAHQKGIIHRDLKPSNILVTVNDGVAVPKIIDFGIAKATQMELTDKTVFTAFEQFIGTPAYMSPEQAEITSVDVDTRSDIYSLGVLLYELLTGKTPFDAKELLQAGLDEMRRTIREKEPERPSTRVSTLDGEELTTTAKRRGLEPLKLVNALRGDLDWIVMKCLEKDRARRYETANGLASDIRRHLNSEPVVACPPSKLYRFQKMVRRNKLTFAATSAIAAALLIGFGVSTWMFVREGEAKREQMRLRQEADSARSQAKADAKAARTEAGKSREVSQFLKDMLRGVGPSVALGRDTTMLREMLDKTTERVGKELANEPETEVELRNTLAEVCQELGLYDKMEKMARENVQLARAQLGQQNALLADALAELGAAMRGRGNDAEAESIFREALFLYRKLPGNHTKDIAWCLDELGSALGGQDKLVEAESLHREALETMKSVVGKEAPELATILNNLAILVSRHTHRQPEAEMLQREALEMNRKFSGNQSPNVATDLNNLAAILNEEGKLPEAESMYRQAVEMNEMLLGKDHPKVAINLDNLGANLQRQGRLKEAEALHRRALEMNAKSFGSNSPAVAGSFGILAYALQEEGKIAEAEQALVARLTTLKKLEADTPGPALGARNDVMLAFDGLWVVLQMQGKLQEAAALKREAAAHARRTAELMEKVESQSADFLSARSGVFGRL